MATTTATTAASAMTETSRTEHIAPMRPPCQDGVLVSNGHLYWGPWMCGCALSLYGNIALSPVQGVGEYHSPPVPQTADELYANALTCRFYFVGWSDRRQTSYACKS